MFLIYLATRRTIIDTGNLSNIVAEVQQCATTCFI